MVYSFEKRVMDMILVLIKGYLKDFFIEVLDYIDLFFYIC